MAEAGPPPLAGRYRFVERLGAGGMGVVWRARDEMLNRDVAVKEVRPAAGLPRAQLAELTERTLLEARAAARLGHPAIVAVHDVISQDGRPWIVMDLVDGRSLEHVIKQDGPLPPERVAAAGIAVLDALTLAHRHGIMHRDVKPANIMIARDGRVLLTDFGIATVEGDAGLTSPGKLVGSPGYIAPERLRGMADGPPADLWSLGATLFAAVEGQAPFHRSMPVAALGAVLTQPTPQPARAGHLGPVLLALLAKDPRQRPGATELRTALQHVARGEAAPEPGGDQPGGRTRGRGRVLAVAAAGVAVLAAALTAVVLLRGDGPPPAPVAGSATTPVPANVAGRFPTVPNPCDVLTAEQVEAIVPGGEPYWDQKNDYCSWSDPDDNVSLQLTLEVHRPTQGRTGPEAAGEFLRDHRDRIRADAGKGLVGSVGTLRDVTGVGKDSFAYDSTALDRVHSTIEFQSSNVLVEVNLSHVGDRPTRALRVEALRAARFVAEELNSRG